MTHVSLIFTNFLQLQLLGMYFNRDKMQSDRIIPILKCIVQEESRKYHRQFTITNIYSFVSPAVHTPLMLSYILSTNIIFPKLSHKNRNQFTN